MRRRHRTSPSRMRNRARPRFADVARVLSAKSAANASTCSHGRFHGANEHAEYRPNEQRVKRPQGRVFMSNQTAEAQHGGCSRRVESATKPDAAAGRYRQTLRPPLNCSWGHQEKMRALRVCTHHFKTQVVERRHRRAWAHGPAARSHNPPIAERRISQRSVKPGVELPDFDQRVDAKASLSPSAMIAPSLSSRSYSSSISPTICSSTSRSALLDRRGARVDRGANGASRRLCLDHKPSRGRTEVELVIRRAAPAW